MARLSPRARLSLEAAAIAAAGLAAILLLEEDQSDVLVLGLLLLAGTAAGLRFQGRSAVVAGAVFGLLVVVATVVDGSDSFVGPAMLTFPGFVAGTALRLHRQTADELALRAEELEAEREAFARLAVRNERARIAAELHDIVGHSLSVMVVQAQAGQRLADLDPDAAQAALEAIAESARQGHEDVSRLVALLGGAEVARPDLTLVDEVVARAARSGLDVSCRFEGDHSATPPATAQLAFRVVQEALTNALRHAPGSAVRVLVRSEGTALVVRVVDDGGLRPGDITGTGRGLTGLRERVQELGGTLAAGLTPTGGWSVEARLPQVS